MYAATNARGGLNSLLWVSEWGYIQATDLRRSEEILTGAIPSAKNGRRACGISATADWLLTSSRIDHRESAWRQTTSDTMQQIPKIRYVVHMNRIVANFLMTAC